MNQKTDKQFKQEIYELYKEEYTVNSKYINAFTKVAITHNKCGHTWNITPNNLLRGKKCPKCYKIPKRTTEQFKKDVFNLVGDEYEVLGCYIDNKTKIDILHKKCGHIFKAVPAHFLFNNRRCTNCNGGIKISHEKFVSQIKKLVVNEYDVLGEYVNNTTKILMKHNICNNNFYMDPSNFKSGNRCPYCSSSRGEKRIRDYLNNKYIKYKEQYRFSNCKHKYTLPFDFALFIDSKLSILIEYDGIQHFKIIEHFGEKSFKITEITDKIKNEYCKTHNIPLLRIPYTEFDNIEIILENYLKQLKFI